MVVFCRYNTEHSSNKKSAILPQDRNKTYNFHFKTYPIYYIIHMSVPQKHMEDFFVDIIDLRT